MTNDLDPLIDALDGSGDFPDRYIPAAFRGLWSAISEDGRLSIHVLDSGGRVLALNGLAAETAGVDVAQAVGRDIGELFPASLAADVREKLNCLVSRGHSCDSDPMVTSTHLLGGRRWRCSMRLLDLRDDKATHEAEQATGSACGRFSNHGILRVCRVASDPDHLENLFERLSKDEDRQVLLGPLSVLTDRELEVAMLIAAGLTDAAIAKRLCRSLRTVHAHRRAIGTKLRKSLGIRTRGDMIRVMTERGLVARVEN